MPAPHLNLPLGGAEEAKGPDEVERAPVAFPLLLGGMVQRQKVDLDRVKRPQQLGHVSEPRAGPPQKGQGPAGSVGRSLGGCQQSRWGQAATVSHWLHVEISISRSGAGSGADQAAHSEDPCACWGGARSPRASALARSTPW